MSDAPKRSTNSEIRAKGFWFVSSPPPIRWFPISWQGWLIFIIFFVIVITEGFRTVAVPNPTNAQLFELLAVIFGIATLINILCRYKGFKNTWN
jgi:hypothetical protein